MIRNNVRWVLVSAMTLVGGCSDSPTAPIPDRGSGIAHVYASNAFYVPGVEAKFSIENNGPDELAYFPCIDYVEHKVGTEWVKVDAFETRSNGDAGCAAAANMIRVPAGAIVPQTIVLKIPAPVDPGSYRIIMESVRPANEVQRPLHVVVSDAFSIYRVIL
ncbi:MAG: hypothetical protein ABJB66_07330 [Gemmatimonadaceae bacterium]